MRTALWIRLAVIVVFAAVVAVQGIWWLAALSAVFAAVTIFQLAETHREREH